MEEQQDEQQEELKAEKRSELNATIHQDEQLQRAICSLPHGTSESIKLRGEVLLQASEWVNKQESIAAGESRIRKSTIPAK